MSRKHIILYNKAKPQAAIAIAAHVTGQSFSFAPSPIPGAEIRIPPSDLLRGDATILRYIARAHPEAQLYGDQSDALSLGEVDQWIEVAEKELSSENEGFSAGLLRLDSHLALRTYFVGHSLSIADISIWASLRAAANWYSNLASAQMATPHLWRWFTYLDSLPAFQAGLQAVGMLAKGPEPAKAVENQKGEKQGTRAPPKASDQGSFDIDLPGATEGNVVTRFPPEPSGYMHIGHAKAALLNHYFARLYKGKMILRFDDTNPTKENEEFEDNIIGDLKTLGITWDVFSHTSDYFDLCEQLCEKMLSQGKFYVDDTPVDQLREERGLGIEAPNRSKAPEFSLALWEEMKKGTKKGLECAVRAKIDMQAKNKALRDPVMYRCNLDPHHRTKDKYKVYPTYDFACPIVDSVEGVTHALRTSEYHDRNDQYYWVIDALGIRKPYIWDYSRMNFVYTLLSKRKLQWFVTKNYVEGWNDPRFPTVQGIMRRGLTVKGLQEFILSQGASKNLNLMEWDKLWTINKRVIDPIAPRYWAINSAGRVEFHLTDGPAIPETKSIPRHKKNADLGKKLITYTSTILLEREDAAVSKEGEEVTLMDWGNAFIDKIERDDKGWVSRLVGHLNLAGDFKKTERKLTWLPQIEDLVPVRLIEYDFLITKKKLEEAEEKEFEKFINPITKYETDALGDTNLRSLQKGETIQLERKGFFICDQVFLRDAKPLVLINIPDGKNGNTPKNPYPGDLPPRK
mmetsp:Transcript_490/g.828  ORF Transcript_490/g.828 Transcript_490/m.828 type:complete len:741 (-) Transcript_490:465-2687(-)